MVLHGYTGKACFYQNPILQVIEYCNHQDRRPNEQMTSDFFDIHTQYLFALLNAANYLNIEELLDECCQRVAMQITSNKPEDIREMFGITNDYTKTEEQQIINDLSWMFST